MTDKKHFTAFRTDYPGIMQVLTNTVGISLPSVPDSKGRINTPVGSYTAIWDTGATNTVITKKVIDDLGFKPISKTIVNGVGGEMESYVYLVQLYLPNKVIVPNIVVTGCEKLSGSADLLIGMDIIARGDFAVSNVDGKTSLSYRIPSVKKIDFVQEAEQIRDNKYKKGKGGKLRKEKKKARLNKKKTRQKKKKK